MLELLKLYHYSNDFSEKEIANLNRVLHSLDTIIP